MNRFDDFHKALSKKNPKFKIAYKDESLLMKIISIILFFNRGFMTEYITTIGSVVYFPSKEIMSKRHESGNIATLAHEYVHASDASHIGLLLFSFFYLFPQSLSIFMLLLIPFNWILAVVLFVVFLLPLPAYWRMKYELRGYKMSLFMQNEISKEVGVNERTRKELMLKAANRMNNNFTGSAYYLMWPFGVNKELVKAVHKIISGDIFSEDSLYKDVAEAFEATTYSS